ncbi:hypothetical protein K1T71_014131 [Dendrolimus kikuchii]|uniref:Uncharacterized protein n=1 Tax=Dendrolimus kikuchii TaxID=765133 RepID=A0ACC1CFA1_9NEOP|nr:hypothetical protein K1T71_014131 [Dendrolimus kikuchii]
MNHVLICDSLLRRNETDPFLKKLVTGDEKWITYDKNVRKRSWSKAGQASQTAAKPGLTRNKVCCVYGGIGRALFIMSYYRQAGPSILNCTANN